MARRYHASGRPRFHSTSVVEVRNVHATARTLNLGSSVSRETRRSGERAQARGERIRARAVESRLAQERRAASRVNDYAELAGE